MIVFTILEYMNRLAKTKQKMLEQGIEVLLISNPSNMYYLTGYNAWSFYVHQMMVVMVDEDQPIWIGREMDASSVKVSTWIDDHHIIPYPDEYVQSTIKHPMDFVANILQEIGQATRKIGLEMDAHYFTGLCYERLQQGLPNATFKNASTLVNWVRLIKSDEEIVFMRRAANIVEKAMSKAYETVDVGVRECDVAANIYHAQISGLDNFGGDYTSIVPMIPTGKNTSCPHLTWTDKRYKNGDNLTIEIAGCYKRYHTPMARTMVLGTPSQQVSDLSEVVLEGINETLAAIKPGMMAEEVEAVWRKTIAKRGYYKDSRLGYSIGLSFPPDWGEHTVSFRKGDRTVLEPNMTFHLMPGIWYEDYGVEITESIRITENGCELLTNFPRELYKKNPTTDLYIEGNCLIKEDF
ncbi:M24 family metallopeptidase [Desertibacillus haloalkaliphilus]|uniref:M24 family metallopeptidase n=1 Tax=Desertibacillus haloalkaliphilus TaxID=1328930 RepID=UPI001C253B8F|nr:Xaa-Pro peptidase family protein [Desertibacillus haloalkaliphilus]MBU8907345.1 Xaa-Pro peptidase family protein [Desertibacillus haloalkaliphilus]